MFFKLAFRNVTRSLKDYSVYFLTLTFGVCLFYVFNSLDGQWAVQALGKSAHYMVESIFIFMNIFSVFVSVVLAGLILYANTFLMKRRKRELGTYFLLGLPVGKVSLLLFLETLFIGVLALATGILLGILAAQGLGLLTMAMFAASIDEMRFVFSLPAVWKTVLYFGVIFLVVMAASGITVSRAKIIDLMQGNRKNEEMKERPLWISVILFLAGVVLLVIAYNMLLARGLLYIDTLFFLMLVLGSLGTLLFFRSLSGFLLRVVKGRKKLYYKDLNMFILRQFNSKIHTTYLSMTVICLMLLLAIGITATSVGLNDTIQQNTDESAPFDLTIMNYGNAEQGDYVPLDLNERLRAVGLDPDALFSEMSSFPIYYNDAAVSGFSEDDANSIVLLSDYNAQMALMGSPALTLEGGAPMMAPKLPMTAYSAGLSIMVIPDELASGLKPRREIINLNYQGDKEAVEAVLREVLYDEEFSKGYMLNCITKLEMYMENMGTKILVLFMGLYLGIVFLLAAAAVLALQQLSQASDNVPRYQILSRLGVEKKMQDRSVLTQVFLAFFVPLSLAVVHSLVGMTAANDVIAQVGKVDSVSSSLVTAFFLLVIYGGYFVATYFGSKRIAKGNL